MRYPVDPYRAASNEDYASGAQAGNPTKVKPSAGDLSDGHRPDEQPAAQWDNWREAQLSNAVAALVHVQYGNFRKAAGAVAGIDYRRFARDPQSGIVIGIRTPEGALINRFGDDPEIDFSETLTPSVGTFDAFDVATAPAAANQAAAVIVGANDTDTSRNVFARHDPYTNSFIEQDTPKSVDMRYVAADLSGQFFALAHSTVGGQRAVLGDITGGGSGWVAISDLPFIPSTRQDQHFAAGPLNNVLFVHSNGTDTKYTHSTDAGTNWSTETTIRAGVLPVDMRFLPNLNKYAILFDDGQIWHSDPGTISFSAVGTPVTAVTNFAYGVLTDAGAVLLGAVDGTTGDAVLLYSFDLGNNYWPAVVTVDPADTFRPIHFDGATIWVHANTGSQNWLRSLYLGDNVPTLWHNSH